MNKQEAIERLKQNKAAAEFYAGMVQNTNAIENELKDIEAIDMAIEALSEPINCVKCKHYYETEDDTDVHGHCRMDTAHTNLISRADAIEAVDERWGDIKRTNKRVAKGHEAVYLDMRATISALPSAEAYFTDGNKIAEWIPVSERLPEEDGWYLVTVQGYETVTDVSLYSADGCAWGDVSTKQKVIAWQPLPTPYKGGDEE